MKHHPLGPSNFPSWEKCPRFDYDPDADKSLAVRGTNLHAALEQAIITRTPPIVEDDQHGQDAVSWAYNYIMDLAGSDPIKAECRVKYTVDDYFASGSEEVVYFGTADYQILRHPGRFMDLLDFKSGFDGDHEAQLTGYALAVFSQKPRLQFINCHVLYGESQKAVKFRVNRIEAYNRITAILNERTQGAPARAHADLCGKCAHAATCQALRDAASLAIPEAKEVEVEVLATGAGIVPADRYKQAFDVARLAEAWADSIKRYLTAQAIGGAEIPGYRLITNEGRRTIEGLDGLAGELKIDEADLLSQCSMTFNELSHIVRKAHDLKKAEADEFIEAAATSKIKTSNGYSYLKATKS
jgi:hypothetical protein